MSVLYRLSRSLYGRLMAGVVGLLLLLGPLAACGGTPAPLQFVPVKIGLPSEALNAPVVGPLADNTQMRIGITFKVSQSVLDHFDQQKIEPGKRSNLENFANQIGISDATYQKIKDFFNLAARTVGAVVVVSAPCFTVPTGRVPTVSVTSTQMVRGSCPTLRRWPMLSLFTLTVSGELSAVQVQQPPSGRLV